MKNEIVTQNGVENTLINIDNGDNTLFVNGTEIVRSRWNGTISVDGVSITFDYARGNAVLQENGTNAFKMIGVVHEEGQGTWKPNTDKQEGYVEAGGSFPNKVWKTDENGVPAWREDEGVSVITIPINPSPEPTANGAIWFTT